MIAVIQPIIDILLYYSPIKIGLAARLSINIDYDIMKRVVFLGDSRAQLRELPLPARQEAGFQLERVQNGLDPFDWKPIRNIGLGVREIRVRDAAGAFRVIYVATFAEAVYVLHAFQKKTQATDKRDLNLAALRFRLLR